MVQNLVDDVAMFGHVRKLREYCIEGPLAGNWLAVVVWAGPHLDRRTDLQLVAATLDLVFEPSGFSLFLQHMRVLHASALSPTMGSVLHCSTLFGNVTTKSGRRQVLDPRTPGHNSRIIATLDPVNLHAASQSGTAQASNYVAEEVEIDALKEPINV